MTKKKPEDTSALHVPPDYKVPDVMLNYVAETGAQAIESIRRDALKDADEAFLTVEQTARKLGISPAAVRKQCRLKQLVAKKQGSRWRISKKALERFEDE